MVCFSLSLALPKPPQIPPIFSSPLNFTLQFPPNPASFKLLCCKYTVPSFSIPLSIPAPIPPAIFAALNALIAAGLLLFSISINLPTCPTDGITQ